MRKLLLAVFLFNLVGHTSDFVNGLPNGHYAGFGTWTDNLGGNGSYDTYVELQNNDMRVDYSWDDQSMTLFLSFWFYDAYAFEVFHQGGKVGYGQCEIDLCTYEIDTPGLHYSETLIFDYDTNGQATLSKVGEKQIGNRLVTWQDGLRYVNLGEPNPIVLPIPEDDTTQQN
jgi:hypothetical protein